MPVLPKSSDSIPVGPAETEAGAADRARSAGRRRSDEGTGESQERLLAAVRAAGLGVYDHDIVTDTIRWDARMRELWGVGRGVPITHELVRSGVHPDDRALVQGHIERALAPASGGRFAAEYRVIHLGSGQLRWVSAAGQVTFSGGRAVRLVGMVQEVTGARTTADALAASEERLRLATNAAGLAIWMWSLSDDRVRWENERPYSLFGVPRTDEPINAARFLADFVHPEDAPHFERAVARTVETAEPLYFLGRFRRPDGTERWLELTGQLLRGDKETGLAILGTGADVTERQRAAEQARRAAEVSAKFHTLFEQSMQYSGILSLEGMVVAANRLCVEGCGFLRDEILGRPFWECGWWSRSAPLAATIHQAFREAADGRTFRAEMPYFVADGSERFVDLIIAPVLDDEGQVLFVAPTGNDITERRWAEARLRLLDSLGQATRAAADPSVVMATSARLLGEHLQAARCAYADVESDNDQLAIRHDWTAAGVPSSVGIYSLDRFGPRAAADLRAGRTLVVRDVASELRPEEGGEMFLSIGIAALICCPLVKEGRMVAMMAIHHAAPRDWTAEEITLVEAVVERSWAHIERIKTAAELRAQDRRKDEFLAMLAHELRNPLAPIRTGLQVLKMTPTGPDADRTRAMMDRQLGHMVRMIDDLLDVSRVRSGKFELKRGRVTAQAVIDHAIEASLPHIEEAAHQLIAPPTTSVVWLDGDLTRLAQVVSNLLTNAAKYTPRGGRIEVSTALEDGQLALRVSDNGAGLSAEMLPAVFHLFSQADRTLDRSQGGLGIGLSLARKLVEMHDGTLEARSAGVGRGCTFTVRLPILEACEAPDPAPIEAPAPPPPAGRRILVVDDNLDGADMLASLLDLTGHVTHTAYDGLDALSAALDFAPEVVFLDIGLPGIDGYEVARRLRAEPRFAGLVLVALTGWGSQEDKRRTREAGFDLHLTKPIEPAAITAVLARLPAPATHR
jgi:PAS domain S-box-containing protein